MKKKVSQKPATTFQLLYEYNTYIYKYMLDDCLTVHVCVCVCMRGY